MSTLILPLFLTGAFLGMRFKVLILIPTVGLVVIAVLWVGILSGDSVSAMLIGAVLPLTALQMGYFCGAALAHIRHPRKVSLQTNPPTRAS